MIAKYSSKGKILSKNTHQKGAKKGKYLTKRGIADNFQLHGGNK